MKKWWRIPETQDAEYDEYDYYYTELPKDEAKWEWYCRKCDSCGKYHRMNFHSVHYFHTMDGWDDLDYTSCWKCELKDKIWSIKKQFEKYKLRSSLYIANFMIKYRRKR